MPLIKVLLILGILVAALLALRGSATAGNRAFWRLGGAALVVIGILSVLFPDALTVAANSVGVGRGADLLLYVAVVAFLLQTILLFRRLRDIEDRHVELVRRVAINEARLPGPVPVEAEQDE